MINPATTNAEIIKNIMSVDVSIPNIEAKLPKTPLIVCPSEFANPTIVDFFSYYVSEATFCMPKTVSISCYVTV
jgi:hypothetical protein